MLMAGALKDFTSVVENLRTNFNLISGVQEDVRKVGVGGEGNLVVSRMLNHAEGQANSQMISIKYWSKIIKR